MTRFCKRHDLEICNETDNNGKYHCPRCGVLNPSRTYTDSVGSESAPQGENPVGDSSPQEIDVTGLSVVEVCRKYATDESQRNWILENRADKVFMVRKAVQ